MLFRSSSGASWQLYLNPGAALTAFQSFDPTLPKLSGDKAIVAACQNRQVSLGCQLDLPLDMLVEWNAARAAAAPPPLPPPGFGAPPADPAMGNPPAGDDPAAAAEPVNPKAAPLKAKAAPAKPGARKRP